MVYQGERQGDCSARFSFPALRLPFPVQKAPVYGEGDPGICLCLQVNAVLFPLQLHRDLTYPVVSLYRKRQEVQSLPGKDAALLSLCMICICRV